MTQIVKFIDVDSDGCGTDIDIYVKLKGKTELTDGVIERTKKVIEEYKQENSYEWQTDTIIDIACEHLETEGYKTETISYDYCIEF